MHSVLYIVPCLVVTSICTMMMKTHPSAEEYVLDNESLDIL